jgi:hypothetical protein
MLSNRLEKVERLDFCRNRKLPVSWYNSHSVEPRNETFFEHEVGSIDVKAVRK